jgi:hypothetical protein
LGPARAESPIDKRVSNTAKATAKAKLAVEKTDMPSRRAIMDAFVGYVKVSFGNQPDVLADFGVHPKARTPLSAEAKTAAAAKREATRAARHTAGSKQKKGVKGAVTGIVVTPVTTPQPVVPAPASPSTPAVTSPGATAGTTPHTS